MDNAIKSDEPEVTESLQEAVLVELFENSKLDKVLNGYKLYTNAAGVKNDVGKSFDKLADAEKYAKDLSNSSGIKGNAAVEVYGMHDKNGEELVLRYDEGKKLEDRKAGLVSTYKSDAKVDNDTKSKEYQAKVAAEKKAAEEKAAAEKKAAQEKAAAEKQAAQEKAAKEKAEKEAAAKKAKEEAEAKKKAAEEKAAEEKAAKMQAKQQKKADKAQAKADKLKAKLNNNSETPVVDSVEETPVVNDEETPVVDNVETTPVNTEVENKEAPVENTTVVNDETPVEETPVVTNNETNKDTTKGNKLNTKIANNKKIVDALKAAGFDVSDLQTTEKSANGQYKQTAKLQQLRKALFGESLESDYEDDEIDECVEQEPIVESDVTKLLNSKEFDTPVSDAEVAAILNDEELSGRTFEDVNIMSLDDVDELDENCIGECIEKSLKDVYENVASFTVTECNLTESALAVNGIIKFVSGKSRPTSYVFTEATKKNDKVVLTGLNENLAKEGKFTLTCGINNKNMIAESLHYNYKIEDDVIEGLATRN